MRDYSKKLKSPESRSLGVTELRSYRVSYRGAPLLKTDEQQITQRYSLEFIILSERVKLLVNFFLAASLFTDYDIHYDC